MSPKGRRKEESRPRGWAQWLVPVMIPWVAHKHGWYRCVSAPKPALLPPNDASRHFSNPCALAALALAALCWSRWCLVCMAVEERQTETSVPKVGMSHMCPLEPHSSFLQTFLMQGLVCTQTWKQHEAVPGEV